MCTQDVLTQIFFLFPLCSVCFGPREMKYTCIIYLFVLRLIKYGKFLSMNEISKLITIYLHFKWFSRFCRFFMIIIELWINYVFICMPGFCVGFFCILCIFLLFFLLFLINFTWYMAHGMERSGFSLFL